MGRVLLKLTPSAKAKINLPMSQPNCLFCKIAAGEIPAKKVLETDDILIFEDIHPKSPIHLLAIPKKHVENLIDLQVGDGPLLAALFQGIKTVAENKKIVTPGFRAVVNNGPDAGQEVMHLHFHILAGRKLAWPPG
jgi:diadenosine tetraphosphate (Ap4A) HIT family hydrolase